MRIDKKWTRTILLSIGQGILSAILLVISNNIAWFASGIEYEYIFIILISLSFSLPIFLFIPIQFKQIYLEQSKRLKLLLFSFLAGWSGTSIISTIAIRSIYYEFSSPMFCLGAAAFYHSIISGFSPRRKCLLSIAAACLGLLLSISLIIGFSFNYISLNINTIACLVLFNIIIMLASQAETG